jgi:dipeptidase D
MKLTMRRSLLRFTSTFISCVGTGPSLSQGLSNISRSVSSKSIMSSSSSSVLMHPAASNIIIPQSNIDAITNLEPKSLWSHFAILSSIPRQSNKEHDVLQFIKNFALHHKLQWKQDSTGNLVVFHPGCGSAGQRASPVIIQGHVDMVTEKNANTIHNFDTDPILLRKFVQNGNEHWLGAQGTTLGSDNGIGVAAALALLEIDPNDTEHSFPPLEALFTVDEETGLTGATNIDVAALGMSGQTMLNLDTEEWGELYVGCAGGGESIISIPLTRDVSADNTQLKQITIIVDGLMGGHSGVNIHEGRANAILLCSAIAQAVMKLDDNARLITITGGDKHNAIPREARAQLLISEDLSTTVTKLVETYQQNAKAEYGLLETNLRMTVIEPSSTESDCNISIDKVSSNRLLSVLLSLPHGVIKYSHSIPDLVETSNNVASLTMSVDSDNAKILCSTRSSISSALEATRTKLESIAYLAGATIHMEPAYPGWNPNMDSKILQLGKLLLEKQLSNTKVGVKAIHAGLECGLLIEKMGGSVDALSFGPTIKGAHSPDECVHIETVQPFFTFVKTILSELVKQENQ